MILPSDEDSRKPDDPEDPPPPWHGEPEPPGFFGDDDAGGGPDQPTVHHPAPEGWREDLREDIEDALAELKEIEDPAEDFDPPEPPDLFAFYGELMAMRNDLRLAAASLSKGMAPPPPDSQEHAVTIKDAMIALIKLHDDLEDSARPLLPLLKPLLKILELDRIKVKAGAAFDPATMTSDAKPSKSSRVAHEIYTGWLWKGMVVRPAHVELK